MSLRLAIKIARSNPIKQRGRNSISRFGAVLTNGRTFYYGYNSYKSHPLAKKFSGKEETICIHAELDAILAWINEMEDLDKYTMYVARVLKDGSPAIAKPCRACQKALIHFGVGNCEWTV